MQTGESWNAPIIPKAYGALNLDKVSKDLPHLEQFVIFSSVVSSTGNEGEHMPAAPCSAKSYRVHYTSNAPVPGAGRI